MTGTEKVLVSELKRFLEEKNKDSNVGELEWLTKEIDDFGFDSVDKLDLVMAIEDRFDLIFDANDIVKCRTLGEIAKSVERLLKPR
jgi:acyl carrier protein